jgi:hypothetical protein
VNGKANGDDQEDEGTEASHGLTPLPREMVEELRVKLAVYQQRPETMPPPARTSEMQRMSKDLP